jgi:glycine cleavage system H lipoate-binding protein
MARQTPAENLTIGFLRYVVNEGQGAVSASGLFSLIPSERNSKTDMLPYNIPLSSATGINLLQLAITIAAGLVVILLIASLINRYRRNHGAGLSERLSHIKGAFSENCLVVPKGLFYDKTHTWAYMEADGTVKVGIDDFLQHVTGKLTRIRTKGIGDRIKKGEPMLTFIQNGKQLVIKSPVSGTIKSENLVLITDPSLINSSPYSDGWFYEIEPSNWLRETQILLMADKYSEWIKGEFHRLRDFLAGIFKPEAPEYSYVILQDGGEIADNVLSSLGPEAWEEFQIQFIDSANQ